MHTYRLLFCKCVGDFTPFHISWENRTQIIMYFIETIYFWSQFCRQQCKRYSNLDTNTLENCLNYTHTRVDRVGSASESYRYKTMQNTVLSLCGISVWSQLLRSSVPFSFRKKDEQTSKSGAQKDPRQEKKNTLTFEVWSKAKKC